MYETVRHLLPSRGQFRLLPAYRFAQIGPHRVDPIATEAVRRVGSEVPETNGPWATLTAAIRTGRFAAPSATTTPPPPPSNATRFPHGTTAQKHRASPGRPWPRGARVALGPTRRKSSAPYNARMWLKRHARAHNARACCGRAPRVEAGARAEHGRHEGLHGAERAVGRDPLLEIDVAAHRGPARFRSMHSCAPGARRQRDRHRAARTPSRSTTCQRPGSGGD